MALKPAPRNEDERRAARESRRSPAITAGRPLPEAQAGSRCGALSKSGRTVPFKKDDLPSNCPASRPFVGDARQEVAGGLASAIGNRTANPGAAFTSINSRGGLGIREAGETALAADRGGMGQGSIRGVAFSRGGASRDDRFSLTEQQRQKILENRDKALARLRDKQKARPAVSAGRASAEEAENVLRQRKPAPPFGSAPQHTANVASTAAATKAAPAKVVVAASSWSWRPAVTTPAAVILPLSATRTAALEPLKRELQSRPGVAVHGASLVGWELEQDVDLVVGVQCAVCVRSRQEFIPLNRSSLSSSPRRQDNPPEPPPRLVGLLQTSLRRYKRVVVMVVDGLEDGRRQQGGGSGDGLSERLREAVGTLDTLHEASIVACRGWRDMADRVEALARQQKSEGLGLPQEVNKQTCVSATKREISPLRHGRKRPVWWRVSVFAWLSTSNSTIALEGIIYIYIYTL